MLVLTVLVVMASGVVLAAQIRADGLGSRPAPRSHHEYFEHPAR